jgi:hypothetical protein
MKKPFDILRYAVWIDHRKAVVFCADDKGALNSLTLRSGQGMRDRFPGEATDKTGLFRHTLQAQRRQQNRENTENRKFLREVVRHLPRASAVLILGPGDARHGLETELRRRKSLNGAWIENRPADKMLMPALRAAVKAHYGL